MAALLAEGPLAAGVAFVDGDGSSGLGFGHDERCRLGVAPASVGGGPAGVGAEASPSARFERVMADGAGHRDGIVT